MLRQPTKVPLHQWDFPAKPWQRLHIDFAGPYQNKMWMLLIDAYSKWPEVHVMESTTTDTVIKHLQQIFATHGLPHQIDGPQFTAEKFKQFCLSRGIHHTTTALYHPHSNGRLKDWYKLLNKVLIRQIRKPLWSFRIV